MNILPLASSSRGNAYIIQIKDTTLLIECGISITTLRDYMYGHNMKITDIDACLITHSHNDHAKCVKELLNLGIDCYMSKGTAQELGVRTHHHTNILKCIKNVNSPKMLGRLYPAVTIKDITVLPYLAVHDTKEPLYFLLRDKNDKTRLLFAIDTAYINCMFKKLTHLMIEVNYDEENLRENMHTGKISLERRNRVVKTHMGLETAKDFIKELDKKNLYEVYIMHMSKSNAFADIVQEEIEKVSGVPVKVCG